MTDKFQIKLSKQFVIVTALMLALNFILELYYVFFMSENFNYLGFKTDFSWIKYIEIKLLLVLFVFLSYYLYKKSSFIYSIFILLLLFFFIPNSIMYAFMDTIRGPIYSIVMLLLLFTFIAPLKLPIKTITSFKFFKHILITGIALILLIPLIIAFKNNFNLNTLFLKDIYETRGLFSERITPLGNYFYNWEVKIVMPTLLAFFLIKKKYLFALMSFGILIYLFVISGNKAVYMTSIVTILFFFIGGENYIRKIKYFLLFLILALIAIPIIDVYVLKGFLLRGTFVMRVFFFPALLNYCYFDFFAYISLYFSENHFFNHFFQSPFKLNSAYLIAIEYFNTNEMYANNGIISDGFMNLGYWGVFLLSSLFTFFFMIFNSIKIDARYLGVFFIFIFFFLSAPMFTVMLTGGLWLLFIFAFTVMKSKN